MNGRNWSRFHLGMMLVWAVLLVPSVIWWKESLLWIISLSLYANFATHFSAWQASRAEVKADEA